LTTSRSAPRMRSGHWGPGFIDFIPQARLRSPCPLQALSACLARCELQAGLTSLTGSEKSHVFPHCRCRLTSWRGFVRIHSRQAHCGQRRKRFVSACRLLRRIAVVASGSPGFLTVLAVTGNRTVFRTALAAPGAGVELVREASVGGKAAFFHFSSPSPPVPPSRGSPFRLRGLSVRPPLPWSGQGPKRLTVSRHF